MTVEAPEEIVQAKRNAARARARVDTDVAALQHRLHPRTIADNAIDTVRDKKDQAVGAARKRPAITAVAGGAVALIVLRKPLKGLYRFVSRRLRKDDNDAAPDSVSAPPDDLIPHAAVPRAATKAKQE
ncbi:MAG: DUF3618 domain-containing protein [Allosphingosinicella sp.]|uniref:DUF3618 domain-containing protein n=1 Tax=Allosphingosinicella sp. TaxID=2823234 RepID=UPI00395E5B6E